MATRLSSNHTRTALSDITNKTPFNKAQFPVTPGPTTLKSSKSFAIFNDTLEAPSARRISSTRKKLRLPKSASKSFETPETKGNHWDVSDVSIDTSGTEETSEMVEDFDDVEYTPPNTIEQKYDPPFEMPDFKEVGATLMSLFRLHTIPEDYNPVTQFDTKELFAELGALEWERPELPEMPLENVFPSLIQTRVPLSSAAGNQPQTRHVRPSNVDTSSNATLPHQVMPCLMPKNSLRIPPQTSIRKPASHAYPLAVNHVSTPPNRKTSHTRIPSWTGAVTRIRSSTVQTTKHTQSQPRSTTVSSSKTIGVPHVRPLNALHSRTATMSKPRSAGKRTPQAKPGPVKIPEDTVLSLFVAGDEVIGEEFLFDV